MFLAAESPPESNAAGVAALERSAGDGRWDHQLEGFDVFPTTSPVLADGAVCYVSNESDCVAALGDISTGD